MIQIFEEPHKSLYLYHLLKNKRIYLLYTIDEKANNDIGSKIYEGEYGIGKCVNCNTKQVARPYDGYDDYDLYHCVKCDFFHGYFGEDFIRVSKKIFLYSGSMLIKDKDDHFPKDKKLHPCKKRFYKYSRIAKKLLLVSDELKSKVILIN